MFYNSEKFVQVKENQDAYKHETMNIQFYLEILSVSCCNCVDCACVSLIGNLVQQLFRDNFM